MEDWLNQWVKAPEVVLKELRKHEKDLQDLDVEITRDLVDEVLRWLEVSDSMAENFKRMVEIQVLAFISWMERSRIIVISKNDQLAVLDLMRDSPWSISIDTLNAFLQSLFQTTDTAEISKQLDWKSKMVWDYLKDYAWMREMSDDMYDALKKHIEHIWAKK